MLKKVARVGDLVYGHFDVLGNEVVGVIVSGSGDTKNGTLSIARDNDIIEIPSHPHQIVEGSPTDYRSHSWRINATGKHSCNGESIARDGDGGKDADWDEFQTPPSAMSIDATTNNLFCS